MPSTLTDTVVRDALQRAAQAARLAPSVHNTQPWAFRITTEGLEMHLDRSRSLHVVDPDGREALISCGAALLNARVALAADRCGVHVERFPLGMAHPLFARVRLVGSAQSDDERSLAASAGVIRVRTTDRTRFETDRPTQELLTRWSAAAACEGSILMTIRGADRRALLAAISRRADDLQNADPAYRAELWAWTSRDPARTDGVPDSAVPSVDGISHDELPLREFDTHGTGGLPADVGSTSRQTLLVLGSQVDDALAWLRAGEALERVLLDMTRSGWAASPFTAVLEIPQTRIAVARELGLPFRPQILLRIGHTAKHAPTTPRRALSEILDGAS